MSPPPPDTSIRSSETGLVIDGQTVPLLGGAFHYFRMPRARWRDALLGMRDLGLHFVDIYAPWAVHETGRGQFDFGTQDERKDLAAALSLADSLELRVMLRPGPHINAELSCFGIPRWIVDDEAYTARGPDGELVPLVVPPRAFAVPSYASTMFRNAVRAWFAKLASMVRPFIYPAGPVTLVQIDNEAAFYFRDGVYDQDYREEAIAAYQAFLKRHYPTLAACAKAHQVQASRWGEIKPPKKFAAQSPWDLVRHLDWAESQEALLSSALQEMGEDLARVGLTGKALTTHNVPMGDIGQPLSPGAFGRIVDLPGADFYERRCHLHIVKRRSLRLAGNVVLPFAAEAGTGGPPWLPPRTDEDTIQALLVGLAYGLRGINLYMAVNRDRWYGAALDERGERTALGKRLGQLLSACRKADFFGLRRVASVGLVIPRTYHRLVRITHTLGALTPALLDICGISPTAACRQQRFGFNYVIQQHFMAWMESAAALLDQAQIPYVYLDSDADPDRLNPLKVLFAPTYELGDRATHDLLSRFASRGGTVFCGPEAPTRDGRMRPLDWPFSDGLLYDLTQNAERRQVLSQLESIADLCPPFRVEGGDIERSLHVGNGVPQVLFLTNFTSRSAEARVRLPAPMRLLDVLSGTTYKGSTQAVVDVPGHTCMMLRIRPPRSDSSRDGGGEHDYAE